MALPMLMVWGVLGGFVYAAQALVLELTNDGSTQRLRTRAIAQFVIALVTAAVFAAGMTHMAQSVLRVGLVINGLPIRGEVGEVPIALTLGWASNYLWPKVLKWLGAAIDRQPTIGNLP